MILFLYGEDNFSSKQKLDAIKEKYIDASLGDTNLSIADFTDRELDFTQITRMILAMPFLAKKRLVIIKDLLSRGNKKIQEQVLGFLAKIPESTLLVIYESGLPDRRTALFKKLNQPKQSQEFKPLEPYQLKKWIIKEVETLGGKIEPAATEKLIEYVGNDSWRLSNEIKKLTTYTLNLTPECVDLLVRAKIDSNIFSFVDQVLAKNKYASQELKKLLDNGENEQYIFSMLAYGFKNLIIIKNLQEQKLDYGQIQRTSKINPYVLQKSMRYTNNFSYSELKKIYSNLLNWDLKIKSGKIESRLALDLFVLEILG
jgi:DNA polymerase-3 subunit delta